MKASFYKLIFDKESPFRCNYIDLPVFEHPWHFHPELELTLILESRGIQYIGDHISRFKEGNLVLVGSNLPHLWLNDKTNSDNEGGRSRRITLQFPHDFMNRIFKDAIELQPLFELFQLADRGISFSDEISNQISKLLFDINEKTGLPKWAAVFDLLSRLTEAKEYNLLASPGYIPQFTNRDCNLMNQIFQYIRKNIENKITLQEMADMACLTKPSFCRFFKKKTSKSFIEFLNEYRINNAKMMLLEDRRSPIGVIAQRSGFPSVQHFNAKFKELNGGLTPSQYINSRG